MTTNTMKTDPINNRQVEIDPSELPSTESISDPVAMSSDRSASELQDLWVPIQMNQPAIFIDDTIASAKAFYNNNRELLKIVGLGILAILAIRLLFAGLNAIDSIPLFTPFLKVVGLVYTVRFVWRYLIREQDRQELVEVFNRTKSEVLGNQN
jgi:CAAD domains of cyanobacterial aminoacyl-tRNA synthetase